MIENADIILLEASITLSVIFSVDTLENILLSLQNLLMNRDERPCTPGNVSFKALLTCLFVREFLVLNRINDQIFIDQFHSCTNNF